MVRTDLQIGKTYWVKWRCRDIGYGVERGSGEYVVVDDYNLGGGQGFKPVDGGKTIYLFDDEIVYCEAD